MSLSFQFKVEPDNPPVEPPEEGAKEKSLVEILLRKYGFGRWTLPADDSSETAVRPKVLQSAGQCFTNLIFRRDPPFPERSSKSKP